jgi:hypothetical protein
VLLIGLSQRKRGLCLRWSVADMLPKGQIVRFYEADLRPSDTTLLSSSYKMLSVVSQAADTPYEVMGARLAVTCQRHLIEGKNDGRFG